MTMIYNHHNANLWHKVLVSTLNGSSFRKSQSKQNTNLPPQKNWGQRQSGRLRIFCWVSTRICVCEHVLMSAFWVCRLLTLFFFIFWLLDDICIIWELVSEMVWLSSISGKSVIGLICPLSDQSTVWRLQDVTASSTLWETKGMSNKSETQQTIFFCCSFVHIFWCTSWGPGPFSASLGVHLFETFSRQGLGLQKSPSHRRLIWRWDAHCDQYVSMSMTQKVGS